MIKHKNEFRSSILAFYELLMFLLNKLLNFGFFLLKEKKPKFFKIKQRITIYIRQIVINYHHISSFYSRELNFFSKGSRKKEAKNIKEKQKVVKKCVHFIQKDETKLTLKKYFINDKTLGSTEHLNNLEASEKMTFDGYQICSYCVFRHEIEDIIDAIEEFDFDLCSEKSADNSVDLRFNSPLKINQFILLDLMKLGVIDIQERDIIGQIVRKSFEEEHNHYFSKILRVKYSCSKLESKMTSSNENICLQSLSSMIFGSFLNSNFSTIEKSIQFLCLMNSSDSNSLFLKSKVMRSFQCIILINPRILFYRYVVKVFTLKLQLSKNNLFISPNGRKPCVN